MDELVNSWSGEIDNFLSGGSPLINTNTILGGSRLNALLASKNI